MRSLLRKRLSTFRLLLSTFYLFFNISLAQAAPVGSPASLLKKGQWDFAVEGGGYLSARPMESSGSPDYEVSLWYGYHSRSYGLTDRLTITGKVGGSYGYIYDETTPGAQIKTSLSGGLVLGAQLKGTILENKALGLEWDGSGQFLYMQSHHKRSGKANSDWYEWQVSTCVAKEIGRFKPYAGVKFSTVTLDHDDGKGNTTSYEEDGAFGAFVGTDIYLGQDRDIIIMLEGGFLPGIEGYTGIKYKF